MNNFSSTGSTLTSKQQILAQLKAKAAARRAQEGPAPPPSQTLQQIEGATKTVTATVTTNNAPPNLKTAANVGKFLSRLSNKTLHNKQRPNTEVVQVKPFATLADPLLLVEADTSPWMAASQDELSIPDHIQQDYNYFKEVCVQNDIPAGIMSLLWTHLLNDLTIINVDTSYSMSTRDGYSPEAKTKLEQNFNVEITDFGENRAGMSIHPPQTRMEEAKSRLKAVMPIVCAANRQGKIHLKSFANPTGVTLNPRVMGTQQMIDEANRFLDLLEPVTNHTPSISSYLNSCKEATAAMRSGEVQSATIIEATDGEPNESFKPEFENIYRHYEQTVLRGGQSYQREDGTRISNSEARILEYGCTDPTPDAPTERTGRPLCHSHYLRSLYR